MSRRAFAEVGSLALALATIALLATLTFTRPAAVAEKPPVAPWTLKQVARHYISQVADVESLDLPRPPKIISVKVTPTGEYAVVRATIFYTVPYSNARAELHRDFVLRNGWNVVRDCSLDGYEPAGCWPGPKA